LIFWALEIDLLTNVHCTYLVASDILLVHEVCNQSSTCTVLKMTP